MRKQKSVPTPELYGLVLAGGHSLRMGQDKSQIIYANFSPIPQRQRVALMLESLGLKTFISCRPQQMQAGDDPKKFILDNSLLDGGPAVGILSAYLFNPTAAWLVTACDFPWMDTDTVKELQNRRHANNISTAAKNLEEMIEPLFAIWEPETLSHFLIKFQQGFKSPQKFLEENKTSIIKIKSSKALMNINTPEQIMSHSELLIK